MFKALLYSLNKQRLGLESLKYFSFESKYYNEIYKHRFKVQSSWKDIRK